MYIMFTRYSKILLSLVTLFVISSCHKQAVTYSQLVQLQKVTVGNISLTIQGPNKDLPPDSIIILQFDRRLDTSTVRKNILLQGSDQLPVFFSLSFSSDLSAARLTPLPSLHGLATYSLAVSSGLKGASGESFNGAVYTFTTGNGKLKLETITVNNIPFPANAHPVNIDINNLDIRLSFSFPLDTTNSAANFTLSGNQVVKVAFSADYKSVTVTNTTPLKGYAKYYFTVMNSLKGKNGFTYDGYYNYFNTALDSTSKFPPIPDEDLLTLIQEKTFRYFYDFAHPACGMARERNSSGDVVTTGGSGFGIMALVVGMNRNFITRDQGIARLGKVLTFLETCDRFHGAWPHWMNGNTGKVVPFADKDDGGDIVETSYMIEGLFTIRQYLDSTNVDEKSLVNRINALANGVEYDWYTRGENVLYWNWSPDYGWAINVKVQGYNETLITYILGAASHTHSISAAVYQQGYARNGAIRNGKSFYGYVLPLGEDYGGPLFFTHYTYLGLDPRNLSDQYANYWEQNVNQSMINYSYCAADPRHYQGYSTHCWGLTASDNPWGYDAQSPTNDLGVITPTAAVSALPYTPVQSMNAIKHFYYILGDRLWGEYGFYDAFDVTEGWWADSYLAIDEGPIICMIENYRSQLLWTLFTSSPEVQASLQKLGFSY